MSDPTDRLIDAALAHVPFDGWSETTLRAAAQDADVDYDTARALFPRGPVDLALAFHRRGDAKMRARLGDEDMGDLRFREKVARAVRIRIEVIPDKEAVRRGTTLFALPVYANDGARAIWGTADAIWDALGDTSQDVNWYTKRATLSGVYASTVLYWLGDDSYDGSDTWEFLDRRIEDVMQIERMKSMVNDNPVARAMMRGPNWLMSRVRAPSAMGDMPGQWRR